MEFSLTSRPILLRAWSPPKRLVTLFAMRTLIVYSPLSPTLLGCHVRWNTRFWMDGGCWLHRLMQLKTPPRFRPQPFGTHQHHCHQQGTVDQILEFGELTQELW